MARDKPSSKKELILPLEYKDTSWYLPKKKNRNMVHCILTIFTIFFVIITLVIWFYQITHAITRYLIYALGHDMQAIFHCDSHVPTLFHQFIYVISENMSLFISIIL